MHGVFHLVNIQNYVLVEVGFRMHLSNYLTLWSYPAMQRVDNKIMLEVYFS